MSVGKDGGVSDGGRREEGLRRKRGREKGWEEGAWGRRGGKQRVEGGYASEHERGMEGARGEGKLRGGRWREHSRDQQIMK